MKSRKSLLALLACGSLLAGCAVGPYYGDPYYGDSYYGRTTTYHERPAYDYYAPSYYYGYPGYYYGPSVSLGLSYGRTWSGRRW